MMVVFMDCNPLRTWQKCEFENDRICYDASNAPKSITI